MPDPNAFPHLPIPAPLTGRARPLRGQTNPREQTNRLNRVSHSAQLANATDHIATVWNERQPISEAEAIFPRGASLLIQVEDGAGLDYLSKSFGFELIAQNENGYVVVTTEDVELSRFRKAIGDFAHAARGSGNIAKIHQVSDDDEARQQQLLIGRLHEQWPLIRDGDLYTIDFGISCDLNEPLPDLPERDGYQSQDRYERALRNYEQEKDRIVQERDSLRIRRESEFEKICRHYSAELLDLTDEPNTDGTGSFTWRVRISGLGLRDIVRNFRFLFEVTFTEDIESPHDSNTTEQGLDESLTLLPPEATAPSLCIIDSGIQEGHRLLAPAMDRLRSRCYIPGQHADVADHVSPNGHGTRVAGAALFGHNIPARGIHALSTWIQNARVLDAYNHMPPTVAPHAILPDLISRYKGSSLHTRIFVQSINESLAIAPRHMSAWAARMDYLSWAEDVLFVQSVGNLLPHSGDSADPGIREHLQRGDTYPEYLRQSHNQLANPGQSLQALTVGSLVRNAFSNGLWRTLGQDDQPATYSRTGLGIWNTIKPDVVEYGGDFVFEGAPDFLHRIESAACPELLRTTLRGGPATARDDCGTSFATPLVAHLAAQLQALFPHEPTLLYRALIAQSARWPDWAVRTATTKHAALNALQHIGFGIPDVDRATTNSPYRITLISQGVRQLAAGEADLYLIPIPTEVRSAGRDAEIRIDITLSYAAEPKRTRRGLRGYLGTRLEWMTSRPNESDSSFRQRLFEESTDRDEVERGQGIRWFLHNRTQWGQVENTSRNHGTLQKDWAVLRSFELPEAFALGIVGRRGWNTSPEARASYTLVITFEAIHEDMEIYTPIRTTIEQNILIPVSS